MNPSLILEQCCQLQLIEPNSFSSIGIFSPPTGSSLIVSVFLSRSCLKTREAIKQS